MGKINLEAIKHITPPDEYYVDKSFDDGLGFIHVPVKMLKIMGAPGIDCDISYLELEIHNKYPNLIFTMRWSSLSVGDETKEYLFYYEQNHR
jgi:hypothetical protein